MDEHQDKLRREIEDLCLEQEGNSASERIQQLESLLMDRPDLQDEYCRVVLLDSLLKTEFGVNKVGFDPFLPAQSQDASPTNRSLPVSTTADAHSATATRSKGWGVGILVAALAASLAFILPRLSSTPTNVDQTSEALAPADSATATLLPSLKTIDMLHRVTRTSWQRPLKSENRYSKSKGNLTVKLVEGAVTMPDFNGKDSGGFVVRLPPGGVLELTAHADAGGDNTLAVMELDSHGEPTGQLVSFGNENGPNGLPEFTTHIFGLIGNWSEINDTKVDKYYLLTGLQRVELPPKGPSWYVADYSVLLNQGDLLYIGWDDTGWSNQETFELRRDRDYNDVTAIVRIKTSAPTKSVRSGIAKVASKLDSDELDPAFELSESLISDGYHFQVRPGERVIANVTSECRLANTLAFVETGSGDIWWQGGNKSSAYQLIGVCLIENKTAESLNFSMVAQHIESSTGEVHPLRHLRTWRDDFGQIIGFDDLAKDEDWDDLEVKLHWIDGDSTPSKVRRDAM